MTNWPDGWREALLTEAGIPQTQFALDVLNYWAQATPVPPWTNNPLGMPSAGTNTPQAFRTGYAAFPTPGDFRKAFAVAAHAGSGKPLFTALAAQAKLSVAWKAIHALGWPANKTETDYPATILDAIGVSGTAGMKVSKASDRKTVGTSPVDSQTHAMIRRQNQAVHTAVSNISDTTKAIQYVVRRMNGNG